MPSQLNANKAKPQNPSSHQLSPIVSLYSQQQLKQALSESRKMLKEFPNSEVLYTIAGASSAGLMQFDAAIDCYKKAIKIKPNYAQAYNNMGVALKDKGDLEAAIDSYKKAININPDFADAYKNLGRLFQLNSQYKESKKCYDKLTDNDSVAKALECIYHLEDYGEFNARLDSIAKKNPANIRVAAISAFMAHQTKQKDYYPFCKNPIELINVSHIKKHVSNANKFISTILDEMNSKNAVWEPKHKSTKAGFQTSKNLFVEPSAAMKLLENIIQKELSLFYSKFKTYNNVLIRNWPKEQKLEGWYVRLLQNGHQDSHIHSGGWVSGVFYLKTVEAPTQNEGAIEFGLHGYDYLVKNEGYPRQTYQPFNGDIILFPSSLFHKTIPVIKDVERCVISFDLLG